MLKWLQENTEWFDPKWFIAVISFASAIIGGIIQSWVSHKFTNKEVTLDKQREAYADYLDALQNNINKSNDAISFENFQKATNKVLLFASNKTAKLINKYFSDSTTIGDNTLTAEEHKKAHDEIFRSMRSDLNLSNKNIGTCSLSRHDPSLSIKKKVIK